MASSPGLRHLGVVLVVILAACGSSPSPRSGGSLAGPGAAFASVPDAGVGSSLGDYLAGHFALERGRLAEAATYFESALTSDPNNLDLQQQLFLLTVASGRYDDALARAETILAQDPAASEARLLLALDLARAGRLGDARTMLEGLGDDGLTGLTVPFIDAWTIFGDGAGRTLDEALARLDQAEALGPLNGYHRAMMLGLGGDSQTALTTLREVMPPAGPAPLRMTEALASMLARAESPAAAAAEVRARAADGAERPALEDLLDALDRGQVPVPPFTDAAGGMADALLGIAEALHQERGAARAVVYARFALFMRPDLGEAALLIGDVMSEQDNLDAAIEAYGSVADDPVLGYLAQLRMARALHAMEQKEQAYTLLEDLAVQRPERVEPLVQLGDLQRRGERYGEAESAYTRAIARLGTPPQREDWTLYYARGITYERTKRWPEAEADFLLALELEPEQPFVLNYLGYSWVDQGLHLDQAKGMLNRAVELRPSDGFIVDSLGWVYYRLGDYEAAVEQLERAVELEPGDPVVNDHLGDALWRVGRIREARFQWRRALSLEPEEDAVAEIEGKLKRGLPAAETAKPDRI